MQSTTQAVSGNVYNRNRRHRQRNRNRNHDRNVDEPAGSTFGAGSQVEVGSIAVTEAVADDVDTCRGARDTAVSMGTSNISANQPSCELGMSEQFTGAESIPAPIPISKNKGKRNKKKTEMTKESPAARTYDPVSGWCAICSVDLMNRRFLAVGCCNHTICSLCALRLRVKSKNSSCVVCKTHLPVMAIYDVFDESLASERPLKEDLSGKEALCAAPRLSDGTLSYKVFPIRELDDHQMDASAAISESILATIASSATQELRVGRSNRTAHASGSPAAVVDYDAKGGAGLLFFNCRHHFFALQELRAITCPICDQLQPESARRNRKYPSAVALQKHIREAHCSQSRGGRQSQSNSLSDRTICALCLENRPIFTAELPVYSPQQLIAHMSGVLNQQSRRQEEQQQQLEIEEHTTGHPACEFCSTNFFDQHALYLHLQREHFTCHLCPANKMFTYYRDSQALMEHQQSQHWVCTHCDVREMQRAGIAVAFADLALLQHHLREFHGVSGTIMAGNYLQQQQRQQQQQQRHVRGDPRRRVVADVMELHMGSASPFAATDSQIASVTSTATAAAAMPSVPPPHMRIAGRVSGTGRFAPLHSAEMRLMDAAVEHNSELQSKHQSKMNKQSRSNLSKEQASNYFPPLSADINTASSVSVAAAAPIDKKLSDPTEPHPLSVLRNPKSIQQQQQEQLRRTAEREAVEAENLRIERNRRLASALFSTDDSYHKQSASGGFSAERLGGTARSESVVTALTAPLLKRFASPYQRPCTWSSQQLMRPLYCPLLVDWARRDRVELQKVERKLYELLSGGVSSGGSGSANRVSSALIGGSQSIQLKPMSKVTRCLVHLLAVYYKLNSYEYDREPNRYVSLVKRVDSCVPHCALSQAVGSSVTKSSASTAISPLPPMCIPSSVVQGTTSAAAGIASSLKLPANGFSAVLVLSARDEAVADAYHNAGTGISVACLLSADQVAAITAVSQATTHSGSSLKASASFGFSIAEITNRVINLLEQPSMWAAFVRDVLAKNSLSASDSRLSSLPVPRIQALLPFGPTAIGFEFESVVAAQLALHFLCHFVVLERLQANSAASSEFDPHLRECISTLLWFNFHATFPPGRAVEALTGDSESAIKESGAASNCDYDQDSRSEQLDIHNAMALQRNENNSFTGFGSSSNSLVADDGWIQMPVKSKALKQETAIETRSSPIPERSPVMCLTMEMSPSDNWEDAFEEDHHQMDDAIVTPSTSTAADDDAEWEEFLAQKRAAALAAANATVGPPTVARYEAKKLTTASLSFAADAVERSRWSNEEVVRRTATSSTPAPAAAAMVGRPTQTSAAPTEVFLEPQVAVHHSSHVHFATYAETAVAIPLDEGEYSSGGDETLVNTSSAAHRNSAIQQQQQHLLGADGNQFASLLLLSTDEDADDAAEEEGV